MGIPFNPAQSLADVRVFGPNRVQGGNIDPVNFAPPNPRRLYLWVFWENTSAPLTILPFKLAPSIGICGQAGTGITIVHNATGPGMVQLGWWIAKTLTQDVYWYEGVRMDIPEGE